MEAKQSHFKYCMEKELSSHPSKQSNSVDRKYLTSETEDLKDTLEIKKFTKLKTAFAPKSNTVFDAHTTRGE